MEHLRGSAESTVDEKGRFKVPAKFREPIEAAGGGEFFVTSITGIEILVYPLPIWAALEAKLAALPFVHRGRTKFLERYNTFGQTVQMDGQGRLLIPALLRETSGIGAEVLVLAQPDSLKVVDKARHFAALAAAPITDEDYDDLARTL
ncbi:MAG: division/cell wall cluster transcriptional repressor MraZ [Holophagales bacterium]|jgi:MraZ protein|nr:division/cell wall cluster transcriptional repressor MraZ [Holophagales bacterium]